MAAESSFTCMCTRQYSFLTSAVKLSDLPGKAKALGIARRGADRPFRQYYGAIRHYKGCKDKGLTPILGCEVFIPRTSSTGALDHLVLLAENHDGYKTWCASCRRGICARRTTTRRP